MVKLLAIREEHSGARRIMFSEGDDVYFRPGQWDALLEFIEASQETSTPESRANAIVSELFTITSHGYAQTDTEKTLTDYLTHALRATEESTRARVMIDSGVSGS